MPNVKQKFVHVTHNWCVLCLLVLLTGVLRAFVNGPFEESFDTTFIENINKLLKKRVNYVFGLHPIHYFSI